MKNLFTILCAFLMAGAQMSAENYYVTPNGNGGRDGKSWDTSWSIAAAVGNAAAGDVVYIASGTYELSQQNSFTKGGITFQGGYDIHDDVSMLLPNYQNKRAVFTNKSTSSFRFWNIGMKTSTTPLIIRGIIHDGNTYTSGPGGLVLINDNTLPITLEYCDFLNATVSGSTTSRGGAISTTNATANYTLTIKNCTFKNLTAIEGGAIAGGGNITYIIDNCKFDNCKTNHPTAGSGHGGVLWANGGSALNTRYTFTNCEVKSSGGNGRGLFYFPTNDATEMNFSKCRFVGNSNSGTGNNGCVFGLQAGGCRLSVENCFGYNNETDKNGSVLQSSTGNSQIRIKNSVFVGNKTIATAAGRGAQAFNFSSGYQTQVADQVTIENTIIANNRNGSSTEMENPSICDIDFPAKTTDWVKATITNSILADQYMEHANEKVVFNAVPYAPYLSASQMNDLTTPSNIDDILAVAAAILSDSPTNLRVNSSVESPFYFNSAYANVYLCNDEVGEIKIFSLQGGLLLSAQAVSQLYIGSLPKGYYFVKALVAGEERCLSILK